MKTPEYKIPEYDIPYYEDNTMHEIKRWNSAAEAAKYYNIQAANICACCTYRRNHCAGFKWRYFI